MKSKNKTVTFREKRRRKRREKYESRRC